MRALERTATLVLCLVHPPVPHREVPSCKTLWSALGREEVRAVRQASNLQAPRC